MNHKTLYLLLPLVAVGGWLLGREPGLSDGPSPAAEKKPLYWVAPMDPSYRRDGPGLSPMGMDLIPVYEESVNDETRAAGTVELTSGLQNQLGVTSAAAAVMPWVDVLRLPAQAVYSPEARWQIQVRTPGWVEEQMVFRVGERVRKGQPLFSWYSPELLSAQDELLVAVRSRDAGLIEASESRLRALNMSEAAIASFRRQGRVNERITETAPADGVITALDLSVGQALGEGRVPVTITSEHLWIEIMIPAGLEGRLRKGDAVTLTDAQGQRLQSSVTALYPIQEKGIQVARADARSAPSWLAGQPLTAALSAQREDVLQVPADAVIDDGHQTRVVLRTDQGFRSVAVATGRRNARFTEIIAGLMAGDEVVTNAQFLIDSESSVGNDLLRYRPLQGSSVDDLGAVIEAFHGDRIVLRHDGVSAWQWPPMRQDLHFAASASGLRAGDRVAVSLLSLDDGDYCVTDIRELASGERVIAQTREPVMDHSAHQMPDHSAPENEDHSAHDTMDHSSHDTMDHSAHEAMDHSSHDTIDHSAHDTMDHSAHETMDHSSHDSMDHSAHEAMDHSAHEAASSARMTEERADDHAHH